VFGLLWTALHLSGVLGSWSDATFIVLGLLAVLASIAGIRRWQPRPRWPWVLIATGLVLFLVGGFARVSLSTLGDLTDSRSLVPDLITLPGYGFLAAGLLLMARARRRGREGNLDATLDATIAALAAITLAWVFLITPALSQQHVPLAVRLLLACYPPMSVFLVALAARIAFSPDSEHVIAFRLVLGALVCMLVGDVVYMLVDVQLVEVPQRLIDLPYALAYVAVAAGVLHPSMAHMAEPVAADQTAPHVGRLAVVALALCVPGVIVLSGTANGLGDRVVLTVIVLALTGTVAWRMFRALRQHAQAERRLVHQATHDALTGLPNRAAIEDRLARLFEMSLSTKSVALLFLDLDRFKLVNDTLGHSVGDDLLVAVSQRLTHNIRGGDLVGRVGGDGFVILVDGIRDSDEATEIAERTRLGFSTPFRVRNMDIPMSASVGVAYRSAVDIDLNVEEVLRDADTAMYQAKGSGGDAVAVFDASMRERVARRLELEHELRRAVERRELEVHFQPIVQIPSARVTGFEALLRWNHPHLGAISPDVFIPVAEDTGLIVDIGAWVIDESCKHLAELRRLIPATENISVAVNVSARQLRDASLLDQVARALLRHSLPASCLVLELTESLVMEDVRVFTSVLSALRDCGVRIAIDDFGTGYSSLAYLRQLPVDKVKIDRSFITDLSDGGAGTSLVAAVVTIARSLGLSTVAEGVETDAQVALLHQLGCDEAQGFRYAEARPASEMAETIRRFGPDTTPHLTIVPSPA
jgi:diguanylate cyclase (GGDEF)-like protein